jgi:hypothetical protein
MPLEKGTVYGLEHLLPPHFSLVRVNDILNEGVSDYTYDPAGTLHTLMMTTRVDRKSDGLDAGSKIDELDWKDWKRPVISLLRAKLLRNRTS